MCEKPVRLAILGTGVMGNNHARQFSSIPGCEIVAAVDVNLKSAQEVAVRYGIPAVYSSVEELLKGDDFDAVSIVAPDAFHSPLSLACLNAGKHVLCEKPLALDYAEAQEMADAALAAGVVNMVNFYYRSWSSLQAVADLIKRGVIGDLRHVEANYLQAWLATERDAWLINPSMIWRLSTSSGSKGVVGDIGVHILDFVTFPVGDISSVHCRLKAFPKVEDNRIGEYTLDANDSAVLSVEFQNGAIGTIHTTRWCGGHSNRLFLKISGTKGTVEIDSDRSVSDYRICEGEGFESSTWRDVTVNDVPNIYQRFITAIRTGTQDQPDFVRGAEIQKILDACFESDAKQVSVSL